MTISGSKYARKSVGSLVLLLFLAVTIVYSQAVHSPFGPVPEDKRSLLAERLQAYTTNFHDGNWGTLYGLVSDADKIRLDGKTMVSKDTFIQAMQRTYEMRHLLKLVPARTEARHLGYDIYGCGEVLRRGEGIVAVRAVWEHGNWFFTDWDYTDPFESCSSLSDPMWKPRIPLGLDGPMMEILCYVRFCEI